MLGLLSGYLQGYLVVKNNQYFDSTFVSAVPVIVLFIVLLILPSARLRGPGHRAHAGDHPDADDARHVHLQRGDRRRYRARHPAPHPLQHRHDGAAVRHRHRRALDGAAHRPRRAGLTRAVEPGRTRRDHDGPSRCRRVAGGPLLGVRADRDRRRPHRAADIAALRHLSGVGHGRVRGVPRTVDLRAPTIQSAVQRREDLHLRNGVAHRRPPQVVRLPVRHRVPAAHAARHHVRAALDLRRVAAARCVRPAVARDEGLPRRLRDGRDEPHLHQACGVLDLRGHRRDRRRAHRRIAAQYEPPGLAVRGRASRVHGRGRGRHRARSAVRCSRASASRRSSPCPRGRYCATSAGSRT